MEEEEKNLALLLPRRADPLRHDPVEELHKLPEPDRVLHVARRVRHAFREGDARAEEPGDIGLPAFPR